MEKPPPPRYLRFVRALALVLAGAATTACEPDCSNCQLLPRGGCDSGSHADAGVRFCPPQCTSHGICGPLAPPELAA